MKMFRTGRTASTAMWLLAAFCLFPPPAAPRAEHGTEDESAIRKVAAAIAAAWERHDAKALAAFWSEEGDLIDPAGRVARGREEIEKLFADEHSTVFKTSHATISDRAVRFLKPDLAIADGSFEITGMRSPDGKDLPPLKGLYTRILVKRGGQWWVIADRPRVPMPSDQD